MSLTGLLRHSNRPVRLEGDGLVLREWSEADLDRMVEIFDEPTVTHRTPLPSPFTRADAQRRLDRALRGEFLLLAVTVDGERPLGEVMVTAEAHLAYVVGCQHRGQGLASRALRAATDYALLVLATPSLWLEIEPDNGASAVVARGAGFKLKDAPEETVQDKGRTYSLQLWERRRTPRPVEDCQARR